MGQFATVSISLMYKKERLKKLVSFTIRSFHKNANKALKYARQKNGKKQKAPTYISIILLEKNFHSFNIVKQLLKVRNYEEAYVLMRFILERIALAYKIINENIPYNQIKKLKVTKCVSDLKKQFTYSGEYYGKLSKFAHSNFPIPFLFYIAYQMNKSKEREIDSSIDIAIHFDLCILLELNHAICQFIIKNKAKKNKWWKIDGNGKWVYTYALPNRTARWELLSLDMLDYFREVI